MALPAGLEPQSEPRPEYKGKGHRPVHGCLSAGGGAIMALPPRRFSIAAAPGL